MQFTFTKIIENIGILSLIVLFIEMIKKYQSEATIDKWKEKKLYTTLCIIISLPVGILVCLKDGVFANDNHWSIILGWCSLVFIALSVSGVFFYDVILKKLLKQKEDVIK